MRNVMEEKGGAFRWITKLTISEVRQYAGEAATQTLLCALKTEKRSGAIAAISRELFSRLQVGDTVYVGDEREPHRVDGITSSGKYITLEWGTMCGRWGWKDVEFGARKNQKKCGGLNEK